jgi:hydroxyacyl-ACP dehydratase HTD2-like protein with hotdog domain
MSVDITLADLGLPDTSVAALDPAHVERIAATLDATVPAAGDALPALWHWAFFTPTSATSGLGTDGHPLLSSAVLAAHPRRMWGAGRVEWQHDLVVGETARRTTALRSCREVSGNSGSLLIVVLDHEYRQGEVLCVREQQTIVYRDPPAERVLLPVDGPPPAAPDGGWIEERRPTSALLFRFSAITFNSHRIHYDLPYARDVEGYPGLVVHGPLTAITLATFIASCTGRPLAAFEFKAVAPMFVDLPTTLVCEPPDGNAVSGSAHVVRNDGTVAMQAGYELRR